MKISEWLAEDPVSLHTVFQKYKLKIDGTVYKILISKIRSNHFEYFRDGLGLNMPIIFKGYDRQVKASIPYKNNPVEFYQWWCENKDQVTMKFHEKIILFDKVFLEKQNALKSEHRKMIKNK